jgi:hypothetical protein
MKAVGTRRTVRSLLAFRKHRTILSAQKNAETIMVPAQVKQFI